MKIRLISTNINNEHPSAVAWKNSRPNNEPLRLSKILSLDLPVNEIPMATLFIESTILEREIILTARNHSCWAQTSRVQDIINFDFPDVFDDEVKYFSEQRLKMIIEDDMGIRQDSYRRHLPIMSSTKYTVNLSMRDMIHLYKFFQKLSKEIDHLRKLFIYAAGSLYTILVNYFNVREDNCLQYKQRQLLKPIDRPESGLLGDIMVINTNISISLRAQLVRHRALHVQDNLLELMQDESIIKKDNQMTINVQVSGLISDWVEIIRKRSCWIAHYDLWKDLLDKAEDFLNLGVSGLPCHDGNCPYDGDAQARYTNDDPNAPCPRHAKLNNIELNNTQIREVYFQISSDRRPDFWLEIK